MIRMYKFGLKLIMKMLLFLCYISSLINYLSSVIQFNLFIFRHCMHENSQLQQL